MKLLIIAENYLKLGRLFSFWSSLRKTILSTSLSRAREKGCEGGEGEGMYVCVCEYLDVRLC